ncbi:hypothetical protein EC968_000756 [Mortierella alpina]|nr:hypothetical protein EC968_000756 [Mortierella alpina]
MSECREHPATEVSYSRHLHLAGVIVILAASTLGVFMPVIATRFRSLRIPSHVLTLGKQFGTGVILATAFIHMLPTAMSNLSSPCLGPTLSQNYQSLGGLLVLSASLVMHWIEFMAIEHTQARMLEAANARGLSKEQSERIHLDLGGLGATGVAAAPCPGQTKTVQEETPCRRSSCSSVSSCGLEHDFSDEESRMILCPSQGSVEEEGSLTVQEGQRLSQATSYGTIPRDRAQQQRNHTYNDSHHRQVSSGSRNGRHHHHVLEVGHSHAHGLELLDVSQRRISTYILEAGVASHSIVIGVALGVSSDAEFTGLLVALVFHQFFEGFALGARIAELDFESTMNHYLLALVFSLTTPIGAALGIVISSSYDPTSVAALLSEGILDAISTGILLYMGYVNLLAVEFNLNGEIRRESRTVKSTTTTSTTTTTTTAMAVNDKSPYAPLGWEGFFDTRRTVPISTDLDPSELTFNVYETNRDLTDAPVIVLHHGAGFCARSFATTTRELKKLLGDQARFLCFDVRGHGETTSNDQQNLQVERLAKDLQNLLLTLYGPGSGHKQMPEFFLVGHSMGGAVVIEFAAQKMIPGISAVAVLDMAEMSLDMAKANIKEWCTTRPKAFDSVEQVVQLGIESKIVRNIESARVSFPGLVTHAPAPAKGYVWHTDLLQSESCWPSWFKDMNQKFLKIQVPKILILAEYGRLDDELQAAYDRGEFQLLIFDGAGHFVQEDQPERMAKELVAFWKQRT